MNRLIFQQVRDPSGDATEASVPSIRVEAAAHLRDNNAEGAADFPEVALVDASPSFVLLSQMIQLLYQGIRIIQKSNNGVQTVYDTDAMGSEFGTVKVINIYSREKALRLRVPLEQVGEDGLSYLDTSAGKLSAPDIFPDALHFMSVLHGAA
jgi:hypothetical protein